MTDSTPAGMQGALSTLLRELVEGAAEPAWVLNPHDPGLLQSLDKLSAAQASTIAAGGEASIAAHVDHLRYGLSLLNRWNRGEDPFADADYSASWRRLRVSDPEWASLRNDLRAELRQWSEAIRQPHDRSEAGLTGILASVVHLAYHLGAIRQIGRATRGPKARD